MRKYILLIITLGFFLSSINLQASIYGTIKGRVVDEEGKPLVGASVRVEGTRLGAVVKQDGRFTIVNVSPGDYIVRITSVGYANYEVNVRISADVITEVDAKMKVEGTTTETVFVQAERAMVENTKIGVQQKFDSKEIASIAREGVQQMVGLSAGVFNSGAGYNIRGARPSETQIRVDGLDVGNQFTGGFGLAGRTYYPMVSAFATEEVQVLTGGFSAEYGDATGGVVNTVVRTGRTDRYDGFLRWRTDVPALWGSQSSGIDIVREGQWLKAYNKGEGKKLQGPNEHTIELGVGGPLPYLDKSTFFVSGKYFYEQFRNYTYEVYDPLGNNVGQLPNNQTWVKNLTGRLKFSVTSDIDFILGTSFGMTNFERMGWGWLYADEPGQIADLPSYNQPEYATKQAVGNQLVAYYMMRVTHRLSQNSFYEITLSNTSNDDEYSKRKSYNDPGFFSGFEIW